MPLVPLVLAGCGRFGFDRLTQPAGDGTTQGDGATSGDGAISGDGTMSGDSGTGAGGSGTVSGSVNSCPGFTGVAAAYAVGHTRGPNEIAVVLMSSYLPCSMLGTSPWTVNLPTNSIALELDAGGTSAATYPVDLNYDPPTGTAASTCYQVTASGNAAEGAQSGSVQMISIAVDGTVTGTFSTTLSDGTFTGTFSAAPCPAGWAI